MQEPHLHRAVSGNMVHVVWEDNTPGLSDIFYRSSANGGATFPNVIKNLSDNIGTSRFPSVTAVSNNVHLVWQYDTPGNNDILYKRSTDGGTTFGSTINLSPEQFHDLPAIAISGNNVYVISNADKAPLVYHGGRYFILNTNVVKPSHEERERIKKVIEKHKKW